jgi:predicted acylesterase/phospholipase RssA
MKRVLILSGGAFRGAVQLPVIQHLIRQHDYDMIFGTSVGSINGVLTAQGDFELLKEIWDNVHNRKQMLKPMWYWPFNGLYSLAPMRELLEEHVSLDKLKIPYAAGVVSFTSGEYYNLRSEDMKEDRELWDAIQASSCMAGIMVPEYIEIEGERHLGVDGGFRNIFPVPDEVEEFCFDVVSCTPIDRMTMKESKDSRGILSLIVKSLEVFQDEIFDKDLAELKRKSKKGSITVYAPLKYPGSSLDASPETIRYRYELGREALKNPVIF